MFDVLIVGLIVTVAVLGLFRLVQWILSFFPAFNSPHPNPAVGRWWVILALVAFFLGHVSELSKQGNFGDWRAGQYLDALLLCFLAYCIAAIWRSDFGKNPRKDQAASEQRMALVPPDDSTSKPADN